MARKAEDIVKDGEKTRFKPGQVTNPNGRPKGVPNAATRFERFLNLIQKGKNPVTKEDEEFTVAELMDLKQIAKALNGDTVAWDKINDRLEGKARQSTELSGKDGEPISLRAMCFDADDGHTFAFVKRPVARGAKMYARADKVVFAGHAQAFVI